nr:whi2-like protein p4h10.16c [Quercus suber]
MYLRRIVIRRLRLVPRMPSGRSTWGYNATPKKSSWPDGWGPNAAGARLTRAVESLHSLARRCAFLATVDSDDAISADSSPPSPPAQPKTSIESHFRLDVQHTTSSSDTPPTFSSHNFPSRYFPDSSSTLVTECAATDSLTAYASSSPAPPFEESSDGRSASLVVVETKAALPRDTKDNKDLDDGEPPPPYTEGSSPLVGFTYVMSTAGGAASILTQVQQGGPAPLNTALGGMSCSVENCGTRFTLSRDELLTLPEFVLLSLFPNGLLPDGHVNSFRDGDVYPVDVSNTQRTVMQAISPLCYDDLHVIMNNQDVYLSDIIYHTQYDPTSLQYMLEFFRHVAQTIPQSDELAQQSNQDPLAPNTMPIEPMAGNARDMLQDRAGIIVLREDLDFYAIQPRKDIEQPEMIEVKRAAGKALLRQDGIFSGLRKSEEPGTTEQHLIEMLTAGGFDQADIWGHRAAEPNKAVICSIALARLRTDIRGEAANSNAVGMAQKLLLFWRKPARRCWWEGITLNDVEGVDGPLKVWIRRVWTLEMVSYRIRTSRRQTTWRNANFCAECHRSSLGLHALAMALAMDGGH